MDHQNRYAVRIKRLEHVHASELLRLVREQQSGRAVGLLFELWILKEMCKRCAQVGLDRNQPLIQTQLGGREWVVELKHTRMATRRGIVRYTTRWTARWTARWTLMRRGRDPQNRSHRERQTFWVILLGRRLILRPLADSQHRNPDPIGHIPRINRLDLKIAAEFQFPEIVVRPRPPIGDSNIVRRTVGADAIAQSRSKIPFAADDPQNGFERGVVQIACTPELGIIRVAKSIELGAKQIQISVAHGHRIHVERFARIAASLIANPQNVSQLRDRVGLFSPFLIGGNSLEVF